MDDPTNAALNSANDNPSRWAATVRYRLNDDAYTEAVHGMEELTELADIIERGPHWDTIIGIEVRLTRPSERGDLTVDEALQL